MRVEFARDVLFGDLFGRAPGALQSADRGAACVHDLRAAAVVERDVQDHPRVRARALDGMRDLALYAALKRGGAPDGLKAYALPINLIKLKPQVTLEHTHQRINFEARALPILGREGVERERAKTEPRAR